MYSFDVVDLSVAVMVSIADLKLRCRLDYVTAQQIVLLCLDFANTIL